MNPESFKNSRAGKVIKVGSGETAYWSFSPTPLPPDIDMSRELVKTLSDADRILGELAGLGRTMPNPHLLIQPFIRREAVLSSRIEGTQANITDLYTFEAEQLAFPGFHSSAEPDVKEVFNYVVALEYGLERINTLPVSLRFIGELHERLMADVRGSYATPGEFRHSQNWIGAPGCTLNGATFVPPAVPEMQSALDSFEKYIHSDCSYPPLIRIGFIHYQFEAIHPFIDGNGRIGRLLISLLLVHWNLLPLPLLYLSAFFEKNRQEYYRQLLGNSEKGDWQSWLIFFLRGVSEQARDAIQRAKQLQDLQHEWRVKLQQTRITGLVFGIVDSLFEKPVISANQTAEKFNVTHQAAMKALRRLEAMGIVREITDKKRNRLYLATDILNIVK